ncbi:GPI-anchored adhesin-like protein [Melia azedarach]|uniref:GPI-anchored adhesin-like protein n=1 Tax=Melia azedarach TaxID=155640 RepID=A0ACC1YKK8_MELAZ|nr:GPI-anchored adhesin-like protein [Melia azedarach]
MNPPSSSKSAKTLNRNGSKIQRRTKKQQCSRNPWHDLNAAIVDSSSSVEAPKGCLRFFLSHSSSTKTPFIDRPIKVKALAKNTPKSAPNPSKLSKRSGLQKPILQKGEKARKNTPCLYQWQSGKKTSLRNGSKSKISSVLDASGSNVNKLTFVSEVGVCDGSDVNLTPLTKVATGSGLDFMVDNKVIVDCEEFDGNGKLSNSSGSKNKTPPIQASVSPEIQTQCGLSAIATATTPACYAAGHVLSGITDKRKCRPRGLLTVGDNNVLDFGIAKSIDSFEEDDGNEEDKAIRLVDGSRRVSIVPLPAEASMHWLLSPCNEEDDMQKENSENELCGLKIHSPSSSLSGDEFGLDLWNDSNNRSVSIGARRSNSLCSPAEVPEFQGILGTFGDTEVISSSPNCTPNCKTAGLEAERRSRYNFDEENSPFSMDTLGSGNVIQTPQSDTSTERCVGMSRLKTEAGQVHHCGSEVDLLAESIQIASLSSKGYESIWDPTSSSFQFDCMMTPSNSVDLSQFQKVLDDRASWISTSTLGNVSQSQMRISWREGLVSRIFEMDEFDSCRYLSDEEENVKSCQKSELDVDAENHEILKPDSADYVDTEQRVKEKGEERLPSQVSCSCAESICTNGGSLAASGDSDWTLYYKNHLFRV